MQHLDSSPQKVSEGCQAGVSRPTNLAQEAEARRAGRGGAQQAEMQTMEESLTTELQKARSHGASYSVTRCQELEALVRRRRLCCPHRRRELERVASPRIRWACEASPCTAQDGRVVGFKKAFFSIALSGGLCSMWRRCEHA